MSQDDASSFDDGRTRVRPSPGGRSRPGPAAPPPPPRRPAYAEPADLRLDTRAAQNPLVAAALPLLSLVPGLLNTLHHGDVKGLWQRLVDEIAVFENTLPGQGLSREYAWMPTYALCSLLDETVQRTPWGAHSFWGQQTLAVQFRRQAWGGEGFFQIVDRLTRQPAQNLALIELCYLCLSLGFQGRYGTDPNGRGELEKYRNELYRLIQRERGEFERALSPRWQGLQPAQGPLLRRVPGWVAGAVAGVALSVAYALFLFAIDGLSEPVRGELARLGGEKISLAGPRPAARPQNPARAERFARLLREEIAQQRVEVADDRTLRVRNAFERGSDQVRPEFWPLLQKIARELGAGQDAVLVTGHTDDTPIQNLRFPSNGALSVARARRVADFLQEAGATRGQVAWEGRADDEPLEPNDSPEHRARNRRVDILIR